jgi:glucan biosynthesis protein C
MAKGGFVIRGRIDGLDAWRAGLMLGGLLVHGSVLSDDLDLFRAIELTSAAFRMGAFFAISGMLAALVMARRRPLDWFLKQSVRVGVPALVGILVLSPITSLMMRSDGNPAHVAAGAALFDWHHLWFLFVLLLYQAIAYLLFTRIDRRRFVGLLRRMRAIGQAGNLAGVGLVSLFLIGATLTAISEWAPERYWPVLLQLRQILRYMPLYFLGFVLGLSRASRVAMLGTVFVPITMLVALGIAALAWYLAMAPGADPASHQWGTTMRLAIEALCPPAAIVLILRSALKIREVRPFWDRLCVASFTIYMLHYPILVAINVLVGPWEWNPYLQYVGAVSFTAALCYALHMRAVQPSWTLSLLLNGRLPQLPRLVRASSA